MLQIKPLQPIKTMTQINHDMQLFKVTDQHQKRARVLLGQLDKYLNMAAELQDDIKHKLKLIRAGNSEYFQQYKIPVGKFLNVWERYCGL